MIDLCRGECAGDKKDPARFQQVMDDLEKLLRLFEVFDEKRTDAGIGRFGVERCQIQGIPLLVMRSTVQARGTRYRTRNHDGRRTDVVAAEVCFPKYMQRPRAPAAMARRNFDQCSRVADTSEKTIAKKKTKLEVMRPKKIGQVYAP